MNLTPLSETEAEPTEADLFTNITQEEADNLAFTLQILSGYSDGDLAEISPSDWLPERLRDNPEMLATRFALAIVQGFIRGRLRGLHSRRGFRRRR
jgi:hypothetical protein